MMAVYELSYIAIFLKGEKNFIMIALVRNKLEFNFILQYIVFEHNRGKYLSTYLVPYTVCPGIWVCVCLYAWMYFKTETRT